MTPKRKLVIALAGNANVGKSLDGETEVKVFYKGKWRIIKLRRLVKEIFNSQQTIKIGESLYSKPKNLFCLSLDKKRMKPVVAKVSCVVEHKNSEDLLMIKTRSGRVIAATKDHNFLIFKKNKVVILDGEHIAAGDLIPAFDELSCDRNMKHEIKEMTSNKLLLDPIDCIKKFKPRDKYVYDLVVEEYENFMLANGAFIHNSVIFNQLTGLHQHIGNWPGKTVEKAEGTLHFRGYEIDIIDLPGIYSLSTFSLEELISREFIAVERPDLVINVVDASVLERNLFFTLQLIELETPIVISLNQIDIASRKGIKIDYRRLERILGVPVVPTVAINGRGIYQLLEKAVDVIEKGRIKPKKIEYGSEVERRIKKLTQLLEKIQFKYPSRWTSIKLLEGDREVKKELRKINPEILEIARKLAEEIEEIHGHSCSTVITSERYEAAGRIVREVQRIVAPIKPSLSERIHNITTHRVVGYIIMSIILLSIFYSIFILGDYFSGILSDILYGFEPSFKSFFGKGPLGSLLWGGILEGIIAGVTIVIPYLVPFYLILYTLEDSGYLSRIAFLTDSLMHRMGLHGKAFIPIMLAYGCNVPACLGCRIMETRRERFLAAFVVTLVPCAAVTVIILGLVGKFVGMNWALTLYIIDVLIIFSLGRLAFKALPGEPTALIMEMSEYRIPHWETVLKQTWFRLEEYIKMAFPLIIAGSFVIKTIEVLGLLRAVQQILSPITTLWLGLPPETGVTLIFGVLRKELMLVMLATLLGTTNFSTVLTSTQMIVFTIVAMLYIPCIATIAALVKEFGWKRASLITILEIFFAIFAGGIAARILVYLNL
ncbi:TPA: ferrous iron transport protein B [Candidatus Bathyarchaeota archaeon]|nr:ferrous iron transport protein B [Candidatus Bathyarchaeota archaeon]